MNKFYSYNYYCRITANSVLTDLVTKDKILRDKGYKVAFGRKMSIFCGLITAETEITANQYFKTYSEAYDYYAQEYTKYIQPIELLVDIK